MWIYNYIGNFSIDGEGDGKEGFEWDDSTTQAWPDFQDWFITKAARERTKVPKEKTAHNWMRGLFPSPVLTKAIS